MTGGGMDGNDAGAMVTRTLEFAAEDGLAVTVIVRIPHGKPTRLAAIRSALVTHAYLFPVGGDGPEAAPPRLGRPRYLRMALVGMAIPLACAGLFAVAISAGFLTAPGGGPAMPEAMRWWMLTALLPTGMAFCALLFVMMEWNVRRFARKATALRVARGLPDPDGSAAGLPIRA